jgi:UDP-glucose 4-epimerase
MKVLVTGSKGFIGHHLLAELKKSGIEAEAVESRIENKDDVEKEVGRKKPEIIIHLAARIPKGPKIDPTNFYNCNIAGTFNLLNASRMHGVKKFIFTSSMAVYGFPKTVPLNEEHPTEPFNQYGLSKLIGELCCKMFKGEFKIVVLRLSSVYGVGVTEPKATRIFAEQVLQGKDLTIYGKGESLNDYVYVQDVLQAFKATITYDKNDYDVFNIGAGQGMTTKNLAKIIIDLAGGSSKLIMVDKEELRPYDFVYDLGKAKRELNYRPHVPAEGLGNYLEDLRRANA